MTPDQTDSPRSAGGGSDPRAAANDAMHETTANVARYALTARGDGVPSEVLREAQRCFLNFAGCAIGGNSHEAVQILRASCMPFGGRPVASLLGSRQATDPLLASLINGASASAHAFDDAHEVAVVHAGSPVCAAALAIAQLEKSGGADLLLAVALGTEITFRLSKAVSVPPAEGDLTWYQTGITGGVGAAIAAGTLMRLDAAQLSDAIGIAVGMASGSRVTHGSMTMLMLAGHAAQCGARAAVLARNGFGGPRNGIEGPYGFAAIYSRKPDLAALTSDLGTRFELLANTYKPYPCGVVLHPVIDACFELLANPAFERDAVREIQVRLSPVALALTDRPQPANRTEAQVSLHHWVAASLRRGRAGLEEGDDTSLHAADIRRMRALVRPLSDASLTKTQAEVRVVLESDQVLSSTLHDRTAPMSDAMLERKFSAQAALFFSNAQIESQLNAIRDLPRARTLDTLAKLL